MPGYLHETMRRKERQEDTRLEDVFIEITEEAQGA